MDKSSMRIRPGASLEVKSEDVLNELALKYIEFYRTLLRISFEGDEHSAELAKKVLKIR